MESELKNKIEKLLEEHKIILFMKGTQNQPLCGFSNHVVGILNELHVAFKDINILEDEELRSGMKEYSNWPTFPQLYVNKELVGGCDIVNEMFNSGELAELFNKLEK